MPKFTLEDVRNMTEWVETILGPLLYTTELNGGGYLYEYWVGSDARVKWSRHHTNHGNKKEHTKVPHDHRWYDDDEGNNTEDKEQLPPNPGFPSPDSKSDNSAKKVVKTVGAVAIGYVIYVGAKWIIAAIAAPATGGGSLIVAGVTP